MMGIPSWDPCCRQESEIQSGKKRWILRLKEPRNVSTKNWNAPQGIHPSDLPISLPDFSAKIPNLPWNLALGSCSYTVDNRHWEVSNTNLSSISRSITKCNQIDGNVDSSKPRVKLSFDILDQVKANYSIFVIESSSYFFAAALPEGIYERKI